MFDGEPLSPDERVQHRMWAKIHFDSSDEARLMLRYEATLQQQEDEAKRQGEGWSKTFEDMQLRLHALMDAQEAELTRLRALERAVVTLLDEIGYDAADAEDSRREVVNISVGDIAALLAPPTEQGAAK